MAEWQIGHQKSSIVLAARFPVVICRSRSVAKSAYWARGKFGEHERGAAECNSSLLSTLQTSQVLNISTYTQLRHELIALMHVYVTQANFTTKPRFEIKNKRSFTEMNSQGSRVEKNTHAQKVQMQKILFTNKACWWNLLVWRNHA